MSDTEKVPVPVSMIDSAARAIAAPGMFDDPPVPPSGVDAYRETYREYARRALAAAFAECEVTAEWGFAHGGNRPGVDGSLSFAESEAEARMWFTDPSTAGDVRLVRRLVITTPAVVVTPAQEG